MKSLKVGNSVAYRNKIGKVVEVCSNRDFVGVALPNNVLKYINRKELTKEKTK